MIGLEVCAAYYLVFGTVYQDDPDDQCEGFQQMIVVNRWPFLAIAALILTLSKTIDFFIANSYQLLANSQRKRGL